MRATIGRLLPVGTKVARISALVVVLAVVAGVIAFVLTGPSSKSVKADFTAAVGIYPGSDVRMLGVAVGRITKVTPRGSYVEIDMQVNNAYKVPDNAIAVIVPPSVVSDRYVQLAPMYTGGPQLANGATIPLTRTAAPVELDQIYKALNQLNVALGPNGANKNGALSNLVNVSAANLSGNGAALGQTIGNLSKAISTLANGREDLFGTVSNLQQFTLTLQQSDAQVRHVNDQLAAVAGQLADERASLAAALKNLTNALTSVAAFLQQNQSIFANDVAGLKAVTGVLANRQGALNEILAVAPVTLSNLTHTYNPSSGTLDTRSNMSSLFDPYSICTVLQNSGQINIAQVTTRLAYICKAVLASGPPTATVPGIPSGQPPLPTIPGVTAPAAATPNVLRTNPGAVPQVNLPIPGVR